MASALTRYQSIRRLGQHTELVQDNMEDGALKVQRIITVAGASEERIGELLSEVLRHCDVTNCCSYCIQLLDSFVYRNNVYLIHEYCEGGSLHALIARAKKYGEILNDIEMLDWTVQILKALEYLHSRNTHHCQINTRNILLKDNSVKLRETAHLRQLYHTMQTTADVEKPQRCDDVTGSCSDDNTPDVCQMEQHTESSGQQACVPIDAKMLPYSCPFTLREDSELEAVDYTDIWSVGCVLYEMTQLKQLHPVRTIEEVTALQQTHSADTLQECHSPNISSLVKRLLTFEGSKDLKVTEILQIPFLVEHITEMEQCPAPVYQPVSISKHLQNNLQVPGCDVTRSRSLEIGDAVKLKCLDDYELSAPLDDDELDDEVLSLL